MPTMPIPLDIREFAAQDETSLIDLWERCGLTRPWNDPSADIKLACKTPTAQIFVAWAKHENTPDLDTSPSRMIGAVMTGFEGHRGWIYYLAVAPENRGVGCGAQLVEHAEFWLKHLGCPKVELMIRPESVEAERFYQKIGYAKEDRLVMARWLTPPSEANGQTPIANTNIDESSKVSAKKLDVTITYLEMSAAPRKPARRPPAATGSLSLIRLHAPTISYYRYIQHTIGDPWLWYERKKMSDAILAEIILDDRVEIYVLSVGGCPAGFIELDLRETARTGAAEIAYFGLFPEFIGKGLGPYLLDWGIHCAWNRTPSPSILKLNTCTLDHPSALQTYQKAGFVPVSQKHERISDPRL